MKATIGIVLLLATAVTVHCKKISTAKTKVAAELNRLDMTPEEKAQSTDIIKLIKTNSRHSREEAARAIETQVKGLFESQDPQAALMRELTYYAIKALRVGGDKLCSDADKITVFRGNNAKTILRTASDKPFFAGNYFLGGGKHLGHALRQYAQKKEAAGDSGSEEAVSPYNYDSLSSRHTRAVEPLLSPFISTTHTSSMASSFGDTTFTMNLCPGRVPSTSEQAWAEQEMLPHLFVLPEEIVAETPSTSLKAKVAPLGWCYAPDIGKGSRSHTKSVDAQTFNDWNKIIVKALAAERTAGSKTDWAGIHKTFTAQCDCASLVRKKNTFWLADYGEGGPLYNQEEECIDYPGYKSKNFLHVTKNQTMLKSGLAIGGSCVVKRGASFAVTTLEHESNHHKFTTTETLPAGCESLANGSLYLSTEHSAVR